MLNPFHLHPLATTASPSRTNSSNILRSKCNTTAGSRQQARAAPTRVTNITTSTSCLPMTYQDAVAVVVATPALGKTATPQQATEAATTTARITNIIISTYT